MSDSSGFDINKAYKGVLFGRNHIGHTTLSAEVTPEHHPWLNDNHSVGVAKAIKVHPNEFTLPRERPKAIINGALATAGTMNRVSNSYLASNVR